MTQLSTLLEDGGESDSSEKPEDPDGLMMGRDAEWHEVPIGGFWFHLHDDHDDWDDEDPLFSAWIQTPDGMDVPVYQRTPADAIWISTDSEFGSRERTLPSRAFWVALYELCIEHNDVGASLWAELPSHECMFLNGIYSQVLREELPPEVDLLVSTAIVLFGNDESDGNAVTAEDGGAT